MDIAYRGEVFGGVINDIKVYGHIPAALLHRYCQIEFATLISEDKTPGEEAIYFFPINRDHIEKISGLSYEDQRNAEKVLKYYSVLTVSDDGETEIMVRIDHILEKSIRNRPDFYIEQFKSAHMA